VFLSARLDWKA